MQILLKRVAVLTLGCLTVFGGIVGLVLPIIPGILLLFIGALVLSSECAWIREMLKRLRIRFPVVDGAFEHVSVRYADWWHRFRFDTADPEVRSRTKSTLRGDA